MKLTTLLLSFLFYFNALAAAPLGVSGQADTSNLYPPVVKVPNKQATKITGGVLLESGNKNILTNPSFEHETYSTGWSLTGTGTYSAETSTVIDGKKALKVTTSSQTFDIIQNSTLYAGQFADGTTQCIATARIKSTHTGTATIYVMKAGVAQTSLSLTVTADGKWGHYKIPFICGGTSNGIEITGTSGTGTFIVDDAKVEPQDVKQDAVFANTQSLVWSRSVNSTIIDFASGTTGDSEGSGLFTVSGPTLTALKTINITANLRYAGAVSSAASGAGISVSISASNGANNGSRIQNQAALSTNNGTSLTTKLAAGETISFGGSATNVTISDQQISVVATEAISSTTYSSTNADTDWASCGHTTSDFTGFGTVTNIETQCKREGSDLLMRGRFTSGTSTAVEARVALKLGGQSLTSKAGGSIAPVGGMASSIVQSGVYTVLSEPSVAYVTFGSPATASVSPLDKRNGSSVLSSGNVGSFEGVRIPINGWDNSNIIIGQFNGLESCADTLECTDTFSAYVSAAGVVSRENVDWINGNCVVASTNQFTCTYKSGIATVPMNCSVVVSDNTTVTSAANLFAGTSSTLTYQTWKGTDTVAIAQPVQVLCQKQGADYIGKTAKAVASDQNVATPGTVKARTCSGIISSAGAISGQDGACIASCSLATSTFTCTFNTNYWAAAPKCNVNIVFGATSNDYRYMVSTLAPSTTTLTYRTGYNLADSAVAVSYNCHGQGM